MLNQKRLASLVDLVLKTEDCFVKTKLDPSILLMQYQELFKEKESQFFIFKIIDDLL